MRLARAEALQAGTASPKRRPIFDRFALHRGAY